MWDFVNGAVFSANSPNEGVAIEAFAFLMAAGCVVQPAARIAARATMVSFMCIGACFWG